MGLDLFIARWMHPDDPPRRVAAEALVDVETPEQNEPLIRQEVAE